MTDEGNTKWRRGASPVRRDCTGPNGSQSGRQNVHNKSRLSFSLRRRPRRSSYGRLRFIRSRRFSPGRRWSGGTTTTTMTILWKFHREFVHAQVVTRNRTRPDAVNMTRKKYGERYVSPQRCVYLFTCTGGNPFLRRSRNVTAYVVAAADIFLIRFGGPRRRPQTHTWGNVHGAESQTLATEKFEKETRKFLGAPRPPPPSTPITLSVRCGPKRGFSTSTKRSVFAVSARRPPHGGPTAHGRRTSVKPNRNCCAFNTGSVVILKNYRHRFVRRTHLNVTPILKTNGPSDLRPLKFQKASIPCRRPPAPIPIRRILKTFKRFATDGY